MKTEPSLHQVSQDILPRMPAWVTATRAESLEDVAFLSGAALAHLNLVTGRSDVPHSLWRARLALQAAEACVAFSGRPERAAELRDEVGLLRPGDLPGPAGAVYLHWREAVARPTSVRSLHKALPAHGVEQIAAWLEAGQGAPVKRAAAVIAAVLSAAPRAEKEALILADVTLAQALGWDHLVPLLAPGLKLRDLRKTGDDLRFACHRAIIASAREAVRIAADLTRRCDRLRAVVPKLRAKGAAEAVEMVLTRDALAPTALTNPSNGVGMSDRAARRLCDRLVDLGVVREMTGRDSFRLYGV